MPNQIPKPSTTEAAISILACSTPQKDLTLNGRPVLRIHSQTVTDRALPMGPKLLRRQRLPRLSLSFRKCD